MFSFFHVTFLFASFFLPFFSLYSPIFRFVALHFSPFLLILQFYLFYFCFKLLHSWVQILMASPLFFRLYSCSSFFPLKKCSSVNFFFSFFKTIFFFFSLFGHLFQILSLLFFLFPSSLPFFLFNFIYFYALSFRFFFSFSSSFIFPFFASLLSSLYCSSFFSSFNFTSSIFQHYFVSLYFVHLSFFYHISFSA